MPRPSPPWEGYAGNNCKLYEDYLISGKEVKTLYTNKPLTVLWDTGLTALVQADGERFYAASATLRQTPLVVPPRPGRRRQQLLRRQQRPVDTAGAVKANSPAKPGLSQKDEVPK